MSNIAIFGGTFNPFHIGHYEMLKALDEDAEIEKILVMPDKKAVERELRVFERWCESVANDPCSPRAFDGMYTSASLLWNAVGVLDTVSAARILYQMYVATEKILEFCEDAVDIHYNCRDQLVYIINENGDAFSEGDMEDYKDIIDEVADE